MLNTIADLLPSTYTHNARVRIRNGCESKCTRVEINKLEATNEHVDVGSLTVTCAPNRSLTHLLERVSARARDRTHLPNSQSQSQQTEPKHAHTRTDRAMAKEVNAINETKPNVPTDRDRIQTKTKHISLYICELSWTSTNEWTEEKIKWNKKWNNLKTVFQVTNTFYNSVVVIPCQNEDVKKLQETRKRNIWI